MSILSLFGEGFESALLTCSLILLIPGAAVGLTAGRKAAIAAVSAFWIGVLGLSWLRFSDRGGGFSNLVIAAGLLVAVIALLVPVIARADRSTPQAMLAGLLAGGAAAELWRPCVGEHFGGLLNSLPERGPSGLSLMAVYLVGTLSPLIIVGALQQLSPESWHPRIEPIGAAIGGLLLGALALATALGLHEALVSQLFLWSIDNV